MKFARIVQGVLRFDGQFKSVNWPRGRGFLLQGARLFFKLHRVALVLGYGAFRIVNNHFQFLSLSREHRNGLGAGVKVFLQNVTRLSRHFLYGGLCQ